MAEKPGVMIYFDSIRPALSRLDDSQLGALFRAIIEYAQTGAVADLDNMAGFAFDSLRPKIDRDDERYQEQCQKSSYAVYCRETKKAGSQPLSFDQWISSDVIRSPTTTAATPTAPSANTSITAFPYIKPTAAAEGSARGESPEASWNAKRNHALDLLEGYHG